MSVADQWRLDPGYRARAGYTEEQTAALAAAFRSGVTPARSSGPLGLPLTTWALLIGAGVLAYMLVRR